MPGRSRWLSPLVIALLSMVPACTAGGSPSGGSPSDGSSAPVSAPTSPGLQPGESGSATAQGEPTAAGSDPAAPEIRSCGGGAEASVHPQWSSAAESRDGIVPLLVSSRIEVGRNRLLYNLTDAQYRVLADAELATEVSLYALERDATRPVATVTGSYLATFDDRGLYRASVDFDCAGEWGLELRARLPDGSRPAGRIRFRVHPDGPTPGIGEPAPRSESPTAASVPELRLISTDPDPFPGAFERTVGEVVTAGQPALVLFATPAFCRTGICGPTVNLVKSVALEYRDQIGFVSVEPYKLQMTENGLQPELDGAGRLQPVQAVLDYGITVEPYLFVVDAAGNVFARFEGVVGEDELRAAIEEAIAAAAQAVPGRSGAALPWARPG